MSGRNVVTRTDSSKKKEVMEELREKSKKESKKFTALINGQVSNYADGALILEQLIPLNCVLSNIVLLVTEMNQPDAVLNIIVTDEKSHKGHGFEIKEGINKIQEKIQLKQGTKLTIRINHPAGISAESVYFGATIIGT